MYHYDESNEVLKDPHITFDDAGILCKISPSSVIRVFDRHCHLTSVTFPETLCIDELYIRGTVISRAVNIHAYYMISIVTGLSMFFLPGLRTIYTITSRSIRTQDAWTASNM